MSVAIVDAKKIDINEMGWPKKWMDKRIKSIDEVLVRDVSRLKEAAENDKTNTVRTAAEWVLERPPFKDRSSPESKILLKLFEYESAISEEKPTAAIVSCHGWMDPKPKDSFIPSLPLSREEISASLELMTKQVGLISNYTEGVGEHVGCFTVELTCLGEVAGAQLHKEVNDLQKLIEKRKAQGEEALIILRA
jgi:hypothetical protein